MSHHFQKKSVQIAFRGLFLAGTVDKKLVTELFKIIKNSKKSQRLHRPHITCCSPLSNAWNLGCAFRLEFRFLPVLIFRNSGYSAEFPEFRGTHVGIKSFQGKINSLRNSGSGIPDPEFRREGPVTSGAGGPACLYRGTGWHTSLL